MRTITIRTISTITATQTQPATPAIAIIPTDNIS